jgi:hypothetical protein
MVAFGSDVMVEGSAAQPLVAGNHCAALHDILTSMLGEELWTKYGF